MVNEEFNEIVNYWIKLIDADMTREELDAKIQKYWNVDLNYIQKHYEDSELYDVKHDIIYSGKELELYYGFYENLCGSSLWPNFLRDFLQKADKDIRCMVEKSAICEKKEEIISKIFSIVFAKCYEISFRTLLQEFNYAVEEGRIKATEVAEQKREFNCLLSDEEYCTALFCTYPELGRILKVITTNFLDYIRQVLEQTENEIEEIRKKIDTRIKYLEDIGIDAGDSHNKGKSVCILQFNDDIKVVYKPRSMENEICFMKIIDYINKNTASDYRKLDAYAFHSNATGGWVEFVQSKECTTKEEVKDYYKRCGELLCIMYLCSSKDFHCENIICKGDQPTLIDLETLLHSIEFDGSLHIGGVYDLALDLVNHSVFKTGFLPMKVVNPKTKRMLEIGALADCSNQVSPFYSWAVFENENGELSMEEFVDTLRSYDNCPKFEGEQQKSVMYIKDIVEGFECTYRYCLENKAELEKNMKEIFTDTVGRIIVRPTNVYDQIVKTAYHPDLLLNSWNRKVFMLKIVDVSQAATEEIIKSEILDMYDGDIPYFVCYADKTGIIDTRKKHIPDVFAKDMLQFCLEKVSALSEVDLHRQIGFIGVSYMEKLEECNIDFPYDSKETLLNLPKEEKTYQEILEKLYQVFADKSLVDKNAERYKRVWLEVYQVPDYPTYVSSINADFYTGMSSMCYMLYVLKDILDNQEIESIYEELKQQILVAFDNVEKEENVKMGAFTGVYSVVYALLLLVERNELELEPVLDIFKDIKDKPIDCVDILAGAAGILKVQLKLRELICKKNSHTDQIEMLDKYIDQTLQIIKDKSIIVDEGEDITWGIEGYTGYAHGNAGIVDALIDYYKVFQDESVLSYIDRGYNYIKNHFIDMIQNWTKTKEDDTYAKGWCHGAPGISLVLMNLRETFGDKYVTEDELIKAKEIIINNGFGDDFCLCHGDMGNLCVLKRIAKELNDEELLGFCKKQLNETLKSINEKIYGNYFYRREDNSLMLGLLAIVAGIIEIGYDKEITAFLSLK